MANPEVFNGSPDNQLYADRDFLVEYGLMMQDHINRTGIDDATRQAELVTLLAELDAACTWANDRVTVTGQRFFSVPMVRSEVTDSRSSVQAEEFEANYGWLNVLGPDSCHGRSHGFGAKVLPVFTDDEFVGQQYLISHMVHDGTTIQGYDNEANAIQVEYIDYYPLAYSRIDFDENNLALDVRHLLKSNEEIFADLDVAMLNDLDFGDQIELIQAALQECDFDNLPEAQKLEIVGYLNSQAFFSPLQVLSGQYVTQNSPDGLLRVIPLLEGIANSYNIQHFVLTHSYKLAGEDGQTTVLYDGTTVGLSMEIYDNDYQRLIVTMPFNQCIGAASALYRDQDLDKEAVEFDPATAEPAEPEESLLSALAGEGLAWAALSLRRGQELLPRPQDLLRLSRRVLSQLPIYYTVEPNLASTSKANEDMILDYVRTWHTR